MAEKKTYTHLEALALAAQELGRKFTNRFGTYRWIDKDGYMMKARDRSGTGKRNEAAFCQYDAPYWDPEPEITDPLVDVLRRTTCRTEPQCKEIAEAFRAEMRKMINGSKVTELNGCGYDVEIKHTISAPE